MSNYIGEITIEDEVANLQMGRPHVLLLGAGASKAALPSGDKKGRPVPVMRDVADQLGLSTFFPRGPARLSLGATLKPPTRNSSSERIRSSGS